MITHTLLRFFKYQHLPQHLQDISKPFAELAESIAARIDPNACEHQMNEYDAGLRKLLEAKDCIVRAAIP